MKGSHVARSRLELLLPSSLAAEKVGVVRERDDARERETDGGERTEANALVR